VVIKKCSKQFIQKYQLIIRLKLNSIPVKHRKEKSGYLSAAKENLEVFKVYSDTG